MPITAALALMGDGSFGILMAGAGQVEAGGVWACPFFLTQGTIIRSISKLVFRILSFPMVYPGSLPSKKGQK